MLFSLDRIEGDKAVLVGDDDSIRVVLLSVLPPNAAAGKMYRAQEDGYVEDADAEQARRDEIRALQNRLRRRNLRRRKE